MANGRVGAGVRTIKIVPGQEGQAFRGSVKNFQEFVADQVPVLMRETKANNERIVKGEVHMFWQPPVPLNKIDFETLRGANGLSVLYVAWAPVANRVIRAVRDSIRSVTRSGAMLSKVYVGRSTSAHGTTFGKWQTASAISKVPSDTVRIAVVSPIIYARRHEPGWYGHFPNVTNGLLESALESVRADFTRGVMGTYTTFIDRVPDPAPGRAAYQDPHQRVPAIVIRAPASRRAREG